jgi:hypothetical protein
MTVYCGRDFSTTELDQIVQLIADNPEYHRADLSREVCRILQWYKADGGLKEMSCRVAMLRMHADGLIDLPTPRRTKPALLPFCSTSATDPKEPILHPVHHLGTLSLHLVGVDCQNNLTSIC